MCMIEKVARAISLALGEEDWTTSVVAARAAVLAMGEPTDDMLSAALPGLPDYGFLPEEYRAMIAFAANEKMELAAA